ncbi:MAG: rhomboid family intramembrane serine protease [Longimicrobiales bacterium]
MADDHGVPGHRVVTASQFVWHDVLTSLRRDPAMIANAQYWRFVTAWLVHDDGLEQIVFSFTTLAILGTFAERLFGRRLWGMAYVACGLVGEVAGIFWQPVGGGNSVALCGLAGLLAVYLAARTDQPVQVRFGFPVVVLGGGILLTAMSDIHGPPLMAGILIGLIARRLRPALFGGNTYQSK